MIKKQFKSMKVYNPFDDKYEYLDAEFECHIDSKNNLDHVDTISVISEGGAELADYLKDEVLEQLANDFKNEYGDWV